MNNFHLKLGTIRIILVMIISMAVGFEESEDIDFEIPRPQSNTFLRTIISDGNDISQDEDSIIQEQRFIRRDQTNSTYYKDRKGRICVLCKWGFVPCCEPNICKPHRIRFNECVEIKSR